MKLSATHEGWLRDFVYNNIHLNISRLVDNQIHHFHNSDKHLEEFNYDNIEWPIDEEDNYIEVFEWWAVSDYLAKKLLSKGELIIESGLLNIWGRTTTGQSITMDYTIREIYKESIGGPQ